MRSSNILINDFFKTFTILYLVFLILEILNPGMVHRFINLEWYFYALLLLYLIKNIFNK